MCCAAWRRSSRLPPCWWPPAGWSRGWLPCWVDRPGAARLASWSVAAELVEESQGVLLGPAHAKSPQTVVLDALHGQFERGGE